MWPSHVPFFFLTAIPFLPFIYITVSVSLAHLPQSLDITSLSHLFSFSFPSHFLSLFFLPFLFSLLCPPQRRVPASLRSTFFRPCRTVPPSSSHRAQTPILYFRRIEQPLLASISVYTCFTLFKLVGSCVYKCEMSKLKVDFIVISSDNFVFN